VSSTKLLAVPDTPAMKDVKRKARRYAAAQKARDDALRELLEACRTADREGQNTRTAIADAAGVSRPTVYAALPMRKG
jgi:hypothetical protein